MQSFAGIPIVTAGDGMLRGDSAAVKPPKKTAAADGSGAPKQQRMNEQLIRLDDLVPRVDVKGRGRSLFGVSNTKPTALNKKKK